ncbi:MAG: hypothetical protein Q8R79_06620 [Legionellaceae bacterium]|nr:hypothetical protein [Legionellaceae bacterium]
MKLLSLLCCLLVERYLIHNLAYGRFSWFSGYYQYCSKRGTPAVPSWLKTLLVFLSIYGVSWLVYRLTHTWLWGIVGFTSQLLVLYYCIGPALVFYPPLDEEANQESLVKQYLSDGNSLIFTLFFWYTCFGIWAALLYRLLWLCAQQDHALWLKRVVFCIEWIPARILGFLYLLAGNFQSGLAVYGKAWWNTNILEETGWAALQSHTSELSNMPAAERLLYCALCLWLVVVAIGTLAV